MLFRGSTLDDVLYRVLKSLLISRRAFPVSSTRGDSRELVGALIRIENPRARLSVAAVRGQLFSCLGELFWYLSGSEALKQIKYYIRKYEIESEDGIKVRSAYGPRLFRMHGLNQVEGIIDLLRSKSSSRRAVIQLFDAMDLQEEKSPPCTCFLQFLVRGHQLHTFVSMRSNDAYVGLPHDVFAFTMLQELIARELGFGIGTYTHAVGSLHLYARDEPHARKYIEEGYQERVFMPPMPSGSPRRAIKELIKFEAAIRTVGCHAPMPKKLDEYWLDIARLLAIYASYKGKQLSQLERLRSEMKSRIFDFAIERRSRMLKKKRIFNQTNLFDKNYSQRATNVSP